MKETKYTFSTWQMASMVSSTLIGVGVLTLPRITSELLQEAGWMASIIGGIIPLLSIWLIAFLSNRFPGMTIIEYSAPLLGSKRAEWMGKILRVPISLLYLGLLYIGVGVTTRLFGEVVVTAVLIETPLEVIMITMFILAVILCMHEPEVVARVNELLFPLIILPILAITFASLQKADWNNILPLFRVNLRDLFKGSLNTSFSYHGFEVMMIYFAFAEPGSSRTRAGFIGIGVGMIIYTLLSAAGILVFAPEELQKLTWPTLELVKSAQVPGLILERLESAFLAVWVAAVFTTVGNIYYAVIYGTRQLFGRGVVFQRLTSLILIIPLFFIALIPQNIIEIFQFTKNLGMIGQIIVPGIPLLYFLIYLLRRTTGRGYVQK